MKFPHLLTVMAKLADHPPPLPDCNYSFFTTSLIFNSTVFVIVYFLSQSKFQIWVVYIVEFF